MWGYGFGWPGMLWMGLGGLLWLALLGLAIWAIVRLVGSRMSTSAPPAPAAPAAEEILRQRFARGEIDAATYDQMRERLRSS